MNSPSPFPPTLALPRFPLPPPTRPPAKRHRTRLALMALLSFSAVVRGSGQTNDSYSFKDPRFIYAPRDRWRRDSEETYTNYTGASVSTTFFGSAIYLSSSKKADRYMLQVVIDDEGPYNVSLNGPATERTAQEVLWGVQLIERNHTFKAFNPGFDPSRPWVAFATLTITTGQAHSDAPAVTSTPLPTHDNESASHNELVRRLAAALSTLVAFGVLMVIGWRHRRRRDARQIAQFLHPREVRMYTLPAQPLSAPPARPPDTHHYTPIRTLATPVLATPFSSPSPNVPKPAPVDELEDEEDESQFWRTRPASNHSSEEHFAPTPPQNRPHLNEQG